MRAVSIFTSASWETIIGRNRRIRPTSAPVVTISPQLSRASRSVSVYTSASGETPARFARPRAEPVERLIHAHAIRICHINNLHGKLSFARVIRNRAAEEDQLVVAMRGNATSRSAFSCGGCQL